MRIEIGIVLALSLSPAFVAFAEAPTSEVVDAVGPSPSAIERDAREDPRAEEASFPSRAEPAGQERDAELPVLHPGGDPLFHLDEPLRRASRARAGRSMSVLEECFGWRDVRCLAAAVAPARIDPASRDPHFPMCDLRTDGPGQPARPAVARARVFERQAPLLLAIPLDGVRLRPLERASTC